MKRKYTFSLTGIGESNLNDVLALETDENLSDVVETTDCRAIAIFIGKKIGMITKRISIYNLQNWRNPILIAKGD